MYKGLPFFKKNFTIDTDTVVLRFRTKYSDRDRCLKRNFKNNFIIKI